MRPAAIAPFVLAATLVAAVEGARLGQPAVALALLGLFAGTGLLAGLLVAGAEWAAAGLTRRLGARRGAGALAVLVRAAPTLLVSVPVARGLFDGAFAASLPGAGAAPVLVPLLGLGATALALHLAARLAARRVGVVVLVTLLVIATALAWLVNRTWLRAGYLDLHAAITVVELVALGAALRLARPAWPRVLALAVVGLGAGAGVLALAAGLRAAEDRLLLASRGDDGRYLVRVWRLVLDRDGDGASAALGGGDCDDGDRRRHPGARDLAGDGLDQDCDGVDAIAPPPPPPPVDDRAWRASPEVSAALAPLARASVLVISIDALRADVLAADAPDRADFPHLAALLGGSTWFTRAFSPAAGTDIAMATLLTARWNPYQRVSVTLLEAARASGRTTTLVVPREVLRYAGETLMSRGVDSVERVVTDGTQRDVGDHPTAEATTDRALAAIARAGDRPSWVWAHYFDAHEHRQIPVDEAALAAVSAGTAPRAHRYRALLAGIDRAVGRLLAELERTGRASSTVVVFLSDHGESLGEDPRLPDNHGNVAYHALTHVPVAIRVPGQPGRVVDAPIGLIDVGPTVLALIGGSGLGEVDGVDQLAHVLGGPASTWPRPRPLVVHEAEQWAVIDWPDKLLVRPGDDVAELYDLAADPGERADRAAREPTRVRALKARYAEFPEVRLDRTAAGRAWRERQAQPRRTPGPP
ncbi:MAG: sulfatase [Kofleriaceae bacterium]|nr:sulfatase [Kofleriaceae bacterium]MBP6838443.1 sulfatase [Kofleriaceae bacterium]MBP9206064.1 sulfatase [Kofleriaceae bacterium]